MISVQNYITEDSLWAEQFNALLLVNDIIKKEQLDHKPIFELVGGTAILFHGIEAVFTVDIDCVNKLTDRVKKLTDVFISDMAGDVALLPRLYELRLVDFEQDKFDSIVVKLLSIEDLVITKLGAFRSKDKEDLLTTTMLDKCNMETLQYIIANEVPINMRNELLSKLSWCISEREMYKCREESNC